MVTMLTQLHHLVTATARRRGLAPALTFKETTLTYAELADRLLACGAGLRQLGLRPGERVAVYLDKRIETVVSFLGASAAGAVFVPVNPLLRPRQVGYILGDCGVRVLVTSAERLELLRDELGEGSSVEHVIIVGGVHDLPPDLPCAVHDWTALSGGEAAPERGGIDLDVASILYTSGSTGQPKGVVLSHRNLLVGGQSVSQYLDNRGDDCILSVLPLSFDAGLSQLTTAFAVGAHVVLMNYLLPGDVVRSERQAPSDRTDMRAASVGPAC